jgi:type VI secretion system protein ImpC
MAETQTQSTQEEGLTLEGSELTILLQKEFKPKSDEAKGAVEQAVRTLAEQAL